MRRCPDELTADLAQYYGIYDRTAHPAGLIATLATQLPEDSRVKRSLSGYACTRSEFLTALAVDRLSYLVWMQTKDGQKNRNRPKSVAEALLDKPSEDPTETFDSPEAFELRRAAIIARATGGD